MFHRGNRIRDAYTVKQCVKRRITHQRPPRGKHDKKQRDYDSGPDEDAAAWMNGRFRNNNIGMSAR